MQAQHHQDDQILFRKIKRGIKDNFIRLRWFGIQPQTSGGQDDQVLFR